MFDLALPWWHFLVRATIFYVALMVFVRVSGKRTIGEFTPFDVLVMILLGQTSQGALLGGDESVLGGLLAAATLIGLNFAVGMISARSRAFDRLTEGEPVVLMRDGVVFGKVLRRNNIPESDLEEAIRKKDLTGHEQVAFAVLETDGKITVVPR